MSLFSWLFRKKEKPRKSISDSWFEAEQEIAHNRAVIKQEIEDRRVDRYINNTALMRWLEWEESPELCFFVDKPMGYMIYDENTARYLDTSIIKIKINERFEQIKEERKLAV